MMAFEWLNEDSRTFLSRGGGYIKPGVTAEQRIRKIADTAEQILDYPGFADKFYEYMGRGFYSLSSPVWSNFGEDTGLPISCNGVYVDDSIEAILQKTAEVGVQTKMGSGTSGYFGDLRARGSHIKGGGKADGPVHYLRMYDVGTDVISQGTTRRGAFAGYLNIDHSDIMEFLEIREPGAHIQNISLGVTISDKWMQEMIDGDAEKRTIWARVLRKRKETGYPYLFFTDTVNNNKPQVLKDKDIPIWASNLCSEICLPSSDEWSFVCNLSSMNLAVWDEWKDTDAVQVLTYFLDAVMEEYITKTNGLKFMESANLFAKTWRALGIGQLGWHTLLQQKMIPFESFEALELTEEISKFIDEKSLEASKEMAEEYGSPEGLVGYGIRNLTRCAIAPTTSSSFIHGQVSPATEPLASNYFVKDLAKGSFTYKNPELGRVLEAHSKDDDETWNSILMKKGSVQHLEFLTQNERDVFKTFSEISPINVVQQAAARQTYIDQAQSLNLMIPPTANMKDVNALIIEGWRLGVKTFYYQRSSNPAQELVRDIMTCVSCEA
jgi:ribonucleoside-diphosphate reductase alpha chain